MEKIHNPIMPVTAEKRQTFKITSTTISILLCFSLHKRTDGRTAVKDI